jgi:hypothetical protein
MRNILRVLTVRLHGVSHTVYLVWAVVEAHNIVVRAACVVLVAYGVAAAVRGDAPS